MCALCAAPKVLDGNSCVAACPGGKTLFGTTCWVGQAVTPNSITIASVAPAAANANVAPVAANDTSVVVVGGLLFGFGSASYGDITLSTAWLAFQLQTSSVRLLTSGGGGIRVLAWPSTLSATGNASLAHFTLRFVCILSAACLDLN